MFKSFFIDEPGNGAETVEIVIGIICSVGLGAALLSFQNILRGVIGDTGTNITNVFNSLAAGATSSAGSGS
ncbi:MAG: hypothetical protein ACI36W_05955 [Coriobacteriales bacterium]